MYACFPLKFITGYSALFVEDDAFSQPHKSLESLWQLLICLSDEVWENPLGLLLLCTLDCS